MRTTKLKDQIKEVRHWKSPFKKNSGRDPMLHLALPQIVMWNTFYCCGMTFVSDSVLLLLQKRNSMIDTNSGERD